MKEFSLCDFRIQTTNSAPSHAVSSGWHIHFLSDFQACGRTSSPGKGLGPGAAGIGTGTVLHGSWHCLCEMVLRFVLLLCQESHLFIQSSFQTPKGLTVHSGVADKKPGGSRAPERWASKAQREHLCWQTSRQGLCEATISIVLVTQLTVPWLIHQLPERIRLYPIIRCKPQIHRMKFTPRTIYHSKSMPFVPLGACLSLFAYF